MLNGIRGINEQKIALLGSIYRNLEITIRQFGSSKRFDDCLKVFIRIKNLSLGPYRYIEGSELIDAIETVKTCAIQI